MLVTTDAIVLKSMKYRDTSRIVTMYTREFGKLKVIAKGARGAKSKFSSALDPLSRVVLVLYRKEQRDLHLASQCDLRCSYHRLTQDLDRMAAGLACLELIDQTSHDEERNEPLFSLTESALDTLDAERTNPEAVLEAFKLRLASIMGFAPNFGTCAVCGRSLRDVDRSPYWFRLTTGSIACGECRSKSRHGVDDNGPGAAASVRLSGRALTALLRCVSDPLGDLAELAWSKAEGNEIHNATRLYLQHHIDHLRPLKSEELLAKPAPRPGQRRI